MTDNVTLPATGLSIATDEIAGVHYQKVISITDKPATVANTAIQSTNHVASYFQFLAANANRKGVIIENGNDTALYLVLSDSSAPANTIKTATLQSGDIFMLQNGDYTGAIYGRWDSVGSNGYAHVTEVA